MTKTMQDYAADDIMLSAEIEKVRTTLTALVKERKELLQAASGVAPGDVVTFRGAEAIVRKVDVSSMYRVDMKPWLKVSVRTKSGEWSKQELHVFKDWESVK